MDLVVGLVENSSTIRVIGRARQDLLSTPTSAQFDYLKATQESVRSGNLRVYRRITGDHLREPFRQHLLELIDSRRPGQIVEVGLVNSIDTLISYQVFDATAAIIGIETARVPGVRDSTIVLLTHQAAIIEALISHFDSAWSSVSPIVESAALKANTTIQV